MTQYFKGTQLLKLSKTFNDAGRRAACLQQLNFFVYCRNTTTTVAVAIYHAHIFRTLLRSCKVFQGVDMT